MALASVGQLASANHKASSSTWAPATSNTIVSGELTVLVLSTDPTTAGDGASSVHSSIRIGGLAGVGGVALTKVAEHQQSGGAGTGVSTSVWYGVTGSIASGTAINVTLAAAVTAKALTAWRFSRTGTVELEAHIGIAENNVDPSAMTLSGLASRQHLFVRGIGQETSSKALTPTAGYTGFDIGGSGTTGQSSSTNITTLAEFRLLSGTEDTSDPTSGDAGTRSASIFVAFSDAEAGATLTQSIADALTLGDAVAMGTGRAVSDTLPVADATAFVAERQITTADTLTLDDAATASVGAQRTASDILGLADSAVAARGQERTTADTLSLADMVAFGYGEAVADTLAVVDSAAASRAVAHTITDTLAASDAVALTLQRSVGDTLALSDALASAVDTTIADALGLSDAIDPGGGLRQLIADTLVVADEITTDWRRVIERAIADSLALSDEVALNHRKGLADSLPVEDSIARAYMIAVADALTLADAVSTGQAGVAIQQSITDTMSLADALSVVRAWSVTVTDAVTLADGQNFTVVRHLSVADALTADDHVATAVDYVRQALDELDLVDAVAVLLRGKHEPISPGMVLNAVIGVAARGHAGRPGPVGGAGALAGSRSGRSVLPRSGRIVR